MVKSSFLVLVVEDEGDVEVFLEGKQGREVVVMKTLLLPAPAPVVLLCHTPVK